LCAAAYFMITTSLLEPDACPRDDTQPPGIAHFSVNSVFTTQPAPTALATNTARRSREPNAAPDQNLLWIDKCMAGWSVLEPGQSTSPGALSTRVLFARSRADQGRLSIHGGRRVQFETPTKPSTRG